MAKQPKKTTSKSASNDTEKEQTKPENKAEVEAKQPVEKSIEENPKPKQNSGIGLPVLGLGLFLCGAAVAVFVGPKVFPGYFGADVDALRAELQAQNQVLVERLEAVEARGPVDPSPAIKQAVQSATDQFDQRLNALQAELSSQNATDPTDRLVALEAEIGSLQTTFKSLRDTMLQADNENGTVAVEAVQAELAALQSQIATLEQQSTAFSTALGGLDARISQSVKSATENLQTLRGANAAAVGQADRAKAVAELRLAVRSGLPFVDQVEILGALGVEVPIAILDAQSGVTTLADLSTEFDDLAHEALRASALTSADQSLTGRLQGFFQSQVSIRSLEQREGSDPDAILSRMAAALDNDDLATVLGEAEGLPEEAKAPLNTWLAKVQTRQSVFAALETLQG